MFRARSPRTDGTCAAAILNSVVTLSLRWGPSAPDPTTFSQAEARRPKARGGIRENSGDCYTASPASGDFVYVVFLPQPHGGVMIDRMSRRILPFLRSLLRFRLRTMLLAVLVFGVGMGVYVNRVKRQQASIAAVKRLGGWAYYDYEVQADGQYDPEGKSWVPAWIRARLADDYFHPIVHVNMVYNDDTGKR